MVGAFFYGGAIFHANSIKFCPPPYYMNIHGGGIFSWGGGGHFFMQQAYSGFSPARYGGIETIRLLRDEGVLAETPSRFDRKA